MSVSYPIHSTLVAALSLLNVPDADRDGGLWIRVTYQVTNGV
jgi:hypothetical protein